MGKSKMMKQQDEPINVQYDEDYVYEQYLLQEKTNEEYWQEQSKNDTIDTINSLYENRFCYMDVMSAIAEVTGDEDFAKQVGDKLNELYIRRLTFDAYVI